VQEVAVEVSSINKLKYVPCQKRRRKPCPPVNTARRVQALVLLQDRQGLANPPSDLKEEPDRLIIESTEEV
jgi:hypothetical protein